MYPLKVSLSNFQLIISAVTAESQYSVFFFLQDTISDVTVLIWFQQAYWHKFNHIAKAYNTLLQNKKLWWSQCDLILFCWFFLYIDVNFPSYLCVIITSLPKLLMLFSVLFSIPKYTCKRSFVRLCHFDRMW